MQEGRQCGFCTADCGDASNVAKIRKGGSDQRQERLGGTGTKAGTLDQAVTNDAGTHLLAQVALRMPSKCLPDLTHSLSNSRQVL